MTAECAAPLELDGFRAGYSAGAVVVDGASFVLERGSLTALVGPNGAGKSTLLKGILGLVPVCTPERARFFGGSLAEHRARVAYLPQRSEISWDFPASALDVAAMGLYARLGPFRRVGRASRDRALEALREVGMAEHAGMQIGELSGGQRQRVLIARALVQDAELMLLDEPFANVDEATERAIAALLAARSARGCTVLAVHHDLTTVRNSFDRAILLHRRVLAHGPAREVLTEPLLARAYGIDVEKAGAA